MYKLLFIDEADNDVGDLMMIATPDFPNWVGENVSFGPETNSRLVAYPYGFVLVATGCWCTENTMGGRMGSTSFTIRRVASRAHGCGEWVLPGGLGSSIRQFHQVRILLSIWCFFPRVLYVTLPTCFKWYVNSCEKMKNSIWMHTYIFTHLFAIIWFWFAKVLIEGPFLFGHVLIVFLLALLWNLHLVLVSLKHHDSKSPLWKRTSFGKLIKLNHHTFNILWPLFVFVKHTCWKVCHEIWIYIYIHLCMLYEHFLYCAVSLGNLLRVV